MDFLSVNPNTLNKNVERNRIEKIKKSLGDKITVKPINGKTIIVIIAAGYPIKQPMQKSTLFILKVWSSANSSHNGWCLKRIGFILLYDNLILCLNVSLESCGFLIFSKSNIFQN